MARCGVIEWVKRSTLRWFGHIERMENDGFVKKVYLSSDEDTNRRGRPLGRWEDRVKECMSEKGVRGNRLEWARKVCIDRESGDPSAMATPLGAPALPGVRCQSY